jgi:hypothetical protein
MLCAPIPYALRTNSLIGADNAIDGMTLEQLLTGILQGCLSGRLATSYVALIHCTMQHPFRHSFPSCLPRAAHTFLGALRAAITHHGASGTNSPYGIRSWKCLTTRVSPAGTLIAAHHRQRSWIRQHRCRLSSGRRSLCGSCRSSCS